MKVRADEHVSEEIVRAVREMALTHPVEISHVVEDGDKGSSDVHWVTRFADQGGKAILSADTDFFRRHHQVVAICDCGLAIFHLPSKWANARCHLQAAHILAWWGRIERKLAEVKPRECWRVPWNLADAGELKRVSVDYENHRRRAKKAERRSA